MLMANVTCVAVGGAGLLIEGPPGSGKSALALALIDRGAVLVGDDGVRLERRDGAVFACPPQTIRGKLEIRGVGIVDKPCAPAPVRLILTLGPAAPRMPEPTARTVLGTAIPVLPFTPGDAVQALRAEHALKAFATAGI